MSKPISISKVCDTWNHKKKTCDESAAVSRLDDKAGSFFVSDLQIDLDGSPQAYHPKDWKKPDNHTQAYDWLSNVKASALLSTQADNASREGRCREFLLPAGRAFVG